MSGKITVMLIDDHPMICQGISSLLRETEDIVFCAEAYDGQQALRLCMELPDVALVDLIMPEMDGIETTRQILARYPQMRVIALTSVVEEQSILDMIDAGASGYLLKSTSLKRIAQMIRVVYDGYTILPNAIMQQVMNSNRIASRSNAPDYDLTR